MKICSIQAMIAMTLCSLALAHDNYGQVLDKKITLSLKEVSIEEALEAIEKLTYVKFFYSVDQLGIKEKISFEAVDRSLRDILDELLAPYQIRYNVHEKKSAITLKRKNDESNDETSSNEKASAFEKNLYVYEITGKVTDAAKQQPMAGVNVLVKGTVRGTVTDNDGNYAIAAEDREVLVFSFIGYETYEVEVSGRTVIDIVLVEDIASLKEVVVNAGYWQVNKQEQTGNIAKIEAKDIERQPVSDPLGTIQSLVPGLEVTQLSGIPGSNYTVKIRGTNSIASGNNPLYVVDGVPYNSSPLAFNETSGQLVFNTNSSNVLANINPADIESIEVLKDADATAIYGSRGANGVILVTTKKGKAGETKVDINFYSGISKVPNKMELLNTSQYLEMRNEAFANDSVTPSVSNATDLLVWDTTRYTDWQKKLIGGTASVTDAQIGISGGNELTQFRIGTGYRNETTVFPGENNNKRVTASTSISNTSSNQKLKISLSANYSHTFTDMLSVDLTSKALTLAPNAPALYDSAGNINWKGYTPTYVNPLAYLNRTFESTTNSLLANSIVSYSILSSLEIRANLGYTNTTYKAVTATPISSLSPDDSQENKSVFSGSQFTNLVIEPQLNWKYQIDEVFLDILVGTTFLGQTTDGLAQYASGFTSEALMKNIAAAPTITAATNYFNEYRYHAVFGRINYNYKSRYILNITGRRDGSSRFGPGKQFAFFKAIGAAWVFSNEQLMQNAMSFLSFGKLRASYGTTGNDQIGDYQFLDTYEISYEYDGIIGLSPSRLYNPNFAWEENKKLEFGLELGAFDDRIFLGISYYRNRSSSQLIGQPVGPTTGFSSIQANFPATVQNTGIEIELNSQNISTPDFTWTTSFNLTIPRNELVNFPDIEDYPEYNRQYVVGEPLTIIKRYNYSGIDPLTGLYTVEDVNEDGTYNFDDRQSTKFLGRNYYGGILNNLRYKGFEIDILLQFVNQEGFNHIRAFQLAPGTLSNQPVDVMDRWQESNPNASFQQFTVAGQGVSSYSSLYYNSNALFGDASFFRIKNISLSYNIVSEWAQSLGIMNARLFIQGQNLITLSTYKGSDPEFPGSFSLPPLRSVIGGVHLTF